jgi:hypothetical protein
MESISPGTPKEECEVLSWARTGDRVPFKMPGSKCHQKSKPSHRWPLRVTITRQHRLIAGTAISPPDTGYFEIFAIEPGR